MVNRWLLRLVSFGEFSKLYKVVMVMLALGIQPEHVGLEPGWNINLDFVLSVLQHKHSARSCLKTDPAQPGRGI